MGPMLRIMIVMPLVGFVLLLDVMPAVAQEEKGVIGAAVARAAVHATATQPRRRLSTCDSAQDVAGKVRDSAGRFPVG